MTWRAYVVDDEPLAVERLVRLLQESGRVDIAGSTSSPRAAQTFLNANRIDLLFLDIHMPGLNGFDLLAGLASTPCVVFTTAHDEFALKAFEVSSVDYLLKPIDAKQLDRALDKFETLRGVPHPSADFQKVCADILSALQARQPDYPTRLASRLGDRVCFVDLASVTHVYADDKLTYAVAEGKRYCIDEPLSELEKRLDPKSFVRIHRATMVNAQWVAEIRSDAGGGMVLRLRDDKHTQLNVARSRAAEVNARLGA